MNPLLWYIPLHLLLASYIGWKLTVQRLDKYGYLSVGSLIAIAIPVVIWPSGLIIVACTCDVSLLDIEVYRRKP